MTAIAYVANTNTITLTGLKNSRTAAELNAATVTLTVKDADGNAVTGETWPIAMTAVGSGGDYYGSFSKTTDLVAGTKYFAHIDADGGPTPELWAHWEFPFTAETRLE